MNPTRAFVDLDDRHLLTSASRCTIGGAVVDVPPSVDDGSANAVARILAAVDKLGWAVDGDYYDSLRRVQGGLTVAVTDPRSDR